MNGLKGLLRWRFLIPLFFILCFFVIFAGWYLVPTRSLDVAVLNKTVSAPQNGESSILPYRKHYGLFWMLNQRRYRNPETGKAYDYRTDYFGLVPEGDEFRENSITRLERTPDLVYLSDLYGIDAEEGGLSLEDMASASIARTNGATLIAEADVFTSATSASVRQEAEEEFGLTYTGWTGRYITDMADLTDVPEWAQSLHQTQYGRPWDYDGAGILLASDAGELVVLESSDFKNSMMQIAVTEDYQQEFGRLSLNYYNWFIITTPAFQAETVAEFQLNLSQSGREKFDRISENASFPAVLRMKDSAAPAYFFAGDFNDYVAQNRFYRFLGSGLFYRLVSYDRPGDITNFYWNFYYPLMKVVLNQAEQNRDSVLQPSHNTQPVFRIREGQFEVQQGEDWAPFAIKGFNINAVMPGAQPYQYTRDISVYRQFLSEIAALGGNCVRVYDLLPPEFYRALYQHNRQSPETPLYFMQTVRTPSHIAATDALAALPQEELRENIAYVVDAVHGNASVPDVGLRTGKAYIQDVSAWLMGYLVQTDTDPQTIAALNAAHTGYRHSGEYVSSSQGAAEGLAAMLCDHLYSYHQQTYGYAKPVGTSGNAALLPGVSWAVPGGTVFDPGRLTLSEQIEHLFFVSFSVQPEDEALLGNPSAFAGYTDEDGSFPYGGYLHALIAAQPSHPVLVDAFGLSTNVNAFEKETDIHGLSESEQGEGIVRMLKAIANENCLGGFISDYYDDWSAYGEDAAPYIIPLQDNPLWHNPLDPAQNKGIAALQPSAASRTIMSVKDNDRMREMQISADAAHLYISVMMDGEIDYDTEQLMLGLDTYQRNNGEYLYHPDYFATSLSGMEFVIRFESRNTAALYVIPSYNREKNGYASRERYEGEFDYICQLTYGSFAQSGNNFYQSGTAIHIRLPWSLLNITNPSKMLVINDTRSASVIANDPLGIQTTATDGILVSLLLADKETKDSLYIFPLDKQASGYKRFAWESWTDIAYVFRQKESARILSRFFHSNPLP